VAVIAPALLAAMPMIAVAQSQPAQTPPDSVAGAQAADLEFKPPPPPIPFGRGGQEVHVWLHSFGGPHQVLSKNWNVVLSAFGRTWSDPIPVTFLSGALLAHVTVPKVRVPTVFSIIEQDSRRIVGEFVAYPEQGVAWDEKIVLYSTRFSTPAWFNWWAKATGLPLKTIERVELEAVEFGQVAEDAKALLILSMGPIDRRDPFHRFVKLANEKNVNILLLGDPNLAYRWADFLGDAAGPAEVGGGQMQGDLLAVTGKQSWREPLPFRFCRSPCGAVMNRWAWILGKDGQPLVESIAAGTAPPEAARSVVLSYLAWEDQLGRREEADATLLAILSAAAKAEPPKIAGHPVEFIYPKKSELNAKERPVLSAVRSVEPEPREDGKPDYNPPIYFILDLRGKEEIRYPDGDLSEICRRSIEDRQAVCELLLLGDDPMLDEWKWLKLDRAKKQIGAAGVQWLPDDDLPPSKESQIRLMLTLTELGVPLAPPEQEEEKP